MEIKFYPVKNAPADTILPSRGNYNDAGYDFYAPYNFEVKPGTRTEIIFLNVKIKMPRQYFLEIKNRSSVMNNGLVLECSGIIDAGYADNKNNDGNIGVAFRNVSNKTIIVKKGDKICQGIILKYYITDDDTATSERVGGWGSTGK